MRGTRAVVDDGRPKRQNLLPHAIAIQHVDTRPPREAGEFRVRCRSRPARDIAASGEVLKQMASGKAGSTGHENSRHSARHVC